MTDIVWGSTRKPGASQRLAELIENNFPEEGFLYIGYPVLSSPEGTNSIDALWVSPRHGIVIFQIVEAAVANGYRDEQDEYANNLETRLRPHKSLMRQRTLLASPTVITYAPRVMNRPNDDAYIIVGDDDIVDVLRDITWEHSELYGAAHSVIQSISSIRRGRRRRQVADQRSRGGRLKALEDSIANLDPIQSRAVIETVEGVQRIRGLAGSGKTIILALKAAYLHAQHPDWKIAVTFNTRSLKGQFLRLIETFVVEQTGEPPVWDNVQVINAWGAPGGLNRTGIYYQFCEANGLEFFDFKSARDKFGAQNEFKGAVEVALKKADAPASLFDVILVDEAQDFDPGFLRLCYASLDHRKRLVYAYDELQTLTESSLPPPEELFGVDRNGNPNVRFSPPRKGQPTQDIILEKCYRNSRPVLATAHALGFGIYRDCDPKSGTGLIQMFDNADLWREVGYSVKHGVLQDGAQVTLERTPQTSPQFLEEPAELDPLVEFRCFADAKEQAQWIADQIERNIKSDELGHDDIIVINPDPLTTVKQVGRPRAILFERGISSHVAGVDTTSDIFFKTDEPSVAFTGVFRAKGNEAGMVYVMNAQDCFSSFGNLGKVRNCLFTAITRSKAWVKVVGFGPDMEALEQEYRRVEGHNYELSFVYPTEETRKHLLVINRELSAEERSTIQGTNATLASVAADFAAGKLVVDDLSQETIEVMRSIFSGGGVKK